jgi:hypothetical protein
VVRAEKPFQVVRVTGSDPRFSFSLPSGAKKVQLVPVKFTAGTTPGKASATIQIETDLPEGRLLKVNASAQVTP